jgi:DNA-binding transcriptional regulator YiaG
MPNLTLKQLERPELPSDAMWIRAARARLGLTQLEFGRRLDVGPSTVSRWENGHEGVSAVVKMAVEHLSCASACPPPG